MKIIEPAAPLSRRYPNRVVLLRLFTDIKKHKTEKKTVNYVHYIQKNETRLYKFLKGNYYWSSNAALKPTKKP